MENGYTVNPGKNEFIEYNGRRFACYAVRTSVITDEDCIDDIVRSFAMPFVKPGDTVFISEKMIACTEGRAYPLDSIKPGFFAKLLSRFVTKSPYGIGLAMPETMQCAINEVGIFRILFAALIGGFGKLFGRKGWFYHIAGQKAAAIDGPCSYTLPPYNKYVVLSPLSPNSTAERISHQLGGNPVLIIDANDLGCNILGVSDSSLDLNMYTQLLRQNPLGQSRQCTPIGILRPLDNISAE